MIQAFLGALAYGMLSLFWHHNPMEQPPRPVKSGLYRPKPQRRVPRSIPDGVFDEIFAKLRSNCVRGHERVPIGGQVKVTAGGRIGVPALRFAS